MSLIASLLMLQAAPVVGTVPKPNAELDAAHSCLVSGTKEWLKEYDWEPEEVERWDWALQVVSKCQTQIDVAADTKGARYWSSEIGGMGITARQMLRSEALYFVDRLIREHFEVELGQAQ